MARWLIVLWVVTARLAHADARGIEALTRGIRSFEAKQYREAEKELETALTRGGLSRAQTLTAYVDLGVTRVALGKTATAEAAFDQAALIDPNFGLPPKSGARAQRLAKSAKHKQDAIGPFHLEVGVPGEAKAGQPFHVTVEMAEDRAALVALVHVIASEPRGSEFETTETGGVARRRRHTAVRADHAPVIDGLLDDPIWKAAPSDDRFRSTKSKPFGKATAEPTSVQVAYDATYLYVAFRCRYSKPRERNDAYAGDETTLLSESENVQVLVDAEHAHTGAYQFAVSPAGVRADAELSDQGSMQNLDWHGIWDVATSFTADGWTAEFAIPWGTALVLGAVHVAYGFARDVVALSVLNFLIAVIMTIGNAAIMTIWQTKVPEDLQGRVLSTMRPVADITIPVSFLIAGPLTDKLAPWVYERTHASSLWGTTASGPMGAVFSVMGVVLFAGFVIATAVRDIRDVEDLPA